MSFPRNRESSNSALEDKPRWILAFAQGCPGKRRGKFDTRSATLAKQGRYGVYSRASDERDSETSALKDANPKTLRRHRGGRASRPSRLRRSLRSASRTLTRVRLDGLFATKTFCCSKRPNGRFRQQNVLVANSHAERSPSLGRGGAQAEHPPWRRAGRHRVARTFEAPWRVDGDRAAWRRAVEGESSAPPKAQAFPRTALRLAGIRGAVAFCVGAGERKGPLGFFMTDL